MSYSFFSINAKLVVLLLMIFTQLLNSQDPLQNFFPLSNTLDIISSFMGLIACDCQLPLSCQNQAGGFIMLTVIVKCINRSMTSKSWEIIPLLNLELAIALRYSANLGH